MNSRLLFFSAVAVSMIMSGCGITKTDSVMATKDTLIPPMGLIVQPSVTSSEHDFDFLEGKWKVHNRMLKERLVGSNEWIEFEAELHMKKTILGLGNVENFYSSINGKPFEGMAVRLFNPETGLWKVYWSDSNNPVMDSNPVTGSFENGIGKLYARDTFNGMQTLILYQWDSTDPAHPKWSQAASQDEGKTWEWNWEMTLTRLESDSVSRT